MPLLCWISRHSSDEFWVRWRTNNVSWQRVPYGDCSHIKRAFVSVNLRGWESDLKVVTGPCTAICRHGDKVIGKEDVDLTSMYFIKHAETAYPGPWLQWRPIQISKALMKGYYSWSKISRMRRSISSPDETQLNTEKRVENTTRSGIFLTNFEVFHLVMKHCRMLDITSQTKGF